MSGREFFIKRYEKLGWKFQEAKLQQAIRINKTNTKDKKLVERLEKRGVNLEKIAFLENGYWVKKSKVSAGASAEYLLGYYSIQEAAAQIPASLFSDLKNKIVLDASAAPGGKTVQMADLMENTGTIIALDINKQRLAALTNHLERCHVSNTIVYQKDARHACELDVKFDRILLDAPCSGNFATDRMWFKRRTQKDIQRNSKVQREILSETVKCLGDSGEIVYSTCSLEPEEDELNIDWSIKNLNLTIEKIDCIGDEGLKRIFGQKLDDSIVNCRRIWPSETQGFFVCKLKKRKTQ